MVKINKRKIKVEIKCHECKEHTYKSLDYLLRRVKEGKTKFFCGRSCADKQHSKSMSGKNNPNFNGKWNGPDPKTILSKEQRRKNTLRQFERYRETGEFNEVLNRLKTGHVKFFSTEEGKAIRSSNGVKAVLSNNRDKRTSIELKMAQELSRRGIEYIEQYNLGNKFALDFFLPNFNIVIECDGDYWHRLPKSIARDKSKNAYVKACGFPLFRFWESEINDDVEACVDVVLAEINAKEAK